MFLSTQSRRARRGRPARQTRRRTLTGRPGVWVLGLAIGGGLLWRRSAAPKGGQSPSGGGATEDQVARIREAAGAAQELPLP